MPNECQFQKTQCLAGKWPDKPHLAGGVEGHNVNDISLPGSVALWVESFTFELGS